MRVAAYSRVDRDPVHFPGLAAVFGESLFETTGIRFDVGNDKADQDRPSVKGFLVIKFAATILERADGRRTHAAGRAAGKVETPLVRLRIVEPQTQGLDVSSRAFHVELHEVRPPVPYFPDFGRSPVFHPGIGMTQRMLETPKVRVPFSDLEIKIVLPVADGVRLS